MSLTWSFLFPRCLIVLRLPSPLLPRTDTFLPQLRTQTAFSTPLLHLIQHRYPILLFSFPHAMKPLLLLLLLLLLPLLASSLSQPLRSTYINCGALAPTQYLGFQWLPDTDFISSGSPKTVTVQDVLPILSTVRSFASVGNTNKKFCYEVPVVRSLKYLVRTTYFYGGVNGDDVRMPPVFDQIVDGTLWGIVNTTEDYQRNLTSYYEGVFKAVGRNMSVCIGVNNYTESDPFISALEVIMVDEEVYNSTDFDQYALSLVARNSFGSNGSIIRFPDDRFDRLWQPFGSYSPEPIVSNVSTSGIWNQPPSKVFETQWTVSTPGTMELQWPQIPLPNATYYIAFYFADGQERLPGFSISINGVSYYNNLSVTPLGLAVFANQWPLSGLTSVTLTPAVGSDVSPFINAGEIFEVMWLGRRTLARDVVSLERLKRNLRNPPPDWSGDPCLPAVYSWTGIECSYGRRIRVVSLNLAQMGISGSLSPSIANLTALTTVLIGHNNISGPIPDLHNLKLLQTLDLENNQLTGSIPAFLGDISSLRELHVQNNKLTGTIPSILIGKPGLNFTFSPGNLLSSPAPAPSPSPSSG